MKVIIAGTRTGGASINSIAEALDEAGFKATEIVSGGASGIDSCGECYAQWAGLPVKKFFANWTCFGRGAGPMRNAKMAAYADALLAYWDGKSPGTLSMIHAMRRLEKPYHVIPLGGVKLIDKHKK